MKLRKRIGLGGVHTNEDKITRAVGKLFAYLTTVVSVFLLEQWHLLSVGHLSATSNALYNWAIWLFFVINFSVVLTMCNDKLRYIKQNWLIPTFILVGLPISLNPTFFAETAQILRPIMALLLLVYWTGAIKRSMSDNRLITTIASLFGVLFIAGFLMSGIDPTIKTPWEGIWWAWVTMSTVGYGDIVPTSLPGRLFASILILLGLGFFSIITANFAALFLRRDVTELKQEESEIIYLLQELKKRIEHIEEHIENNQSSKKK